MALQWNWKDKMGKLTIRRKMKKYYINIYSGNALAVFIHEYKDSDGKEMYYTIFSLTRNTSRILSVATRT